MSSLFVLVTLSVVLAASAFAQTDPPASPDASLGGLPTPSAIPNPSIEFPIGELGDCATKGECINYCQDPVNYNACVEFAKDKGFYQDDYAKITDSEFLEKAKDELGCDSPEACTTYCSDPANFDQCDAFSKDQEIIGGYVHEPDKPEFLQIAKEVLGCDSAAACANACDDPANSQKCTEFANRVGLLGGEVKEGPGGCTSEATCLNFCHDPGNFQKCVAYAAPNTTFQGPGGCTDPNSCRSYCEQNSNECRSYAPGSNGRYIPISCPAGQYFGPGGACTAVEKAQDAAACAGAVKYWDGASCSDQAPPGVYVGIGNPYFTTRPDMGNCTTPGSCYDWCKENPGKCGGFNTDMPRPDDYIPIFKYDHDAKFEPKADMGNCTNPGSCYDWCSANPGKCGGFSPDYGRPDQTYPDTPPPDFWGRQGGPNTTPYFPGYVPPDGSSPPPGSYPQASPYGAPYTPGYPPTPNYDWCAQNPGKCGGTPYNPSSGSPYPQPYSPSYPQPGTQPGTGPYPYYTPPSSGPYTPPSSGTYTPPSSGSYTPPSSDSGSQPAPAPADSGGSAPAPAPADSGSSGGGGSYTPPSNSGGSAPVVQGTKTQDNLFTRIFQLIFGKK